VVVGEPGIQAAWGRGRTRSQHLGQDIRRWSSCPYSFSMELSYSHWPGAPRALGKPTDSQLLFWVLLPDGSGAQLCIWGLHWLGSSVWQVW
jgi:hypothetical protein